MEEAITNKATDTTPVATQVATEENSIVDKEPQVEAPVNEGGQPVENSDTEQESDGQFAEQPVVEDKQPTIEELQTKLKEYELRDEEDKLLRDKLGLSDVDNQTYNLMNIDQQIVNEGKQVYLRLCNEYGVDANPEKIDESVAKLKETNPAKAYEFQRKFEQLGNEVSYKRQEIQQQNNIYEINKFEKDYRQLLQAAPALNNIMAQYVEAYGVNTTGMYNQLKSVMDIVLPAYQEAFNAGRQYALQDRAKKDTSGVSGGVATANTQTYTPGNVFTREQIAKMSTEEFAKYEKQIQQQMIEGKII